MERNQLKAKSIAQEYLKAKIVALLVLGETGAGKSSLCQTIGDFVQGQFKFKGGVNPCTTEIEYRILKWKRSQTQFLLIDTPGFLEGAQKDQQNLNNIIITLQELQKINGIVIAINSQNPRINSGLQQMLIELSLVFGQENFHKLVSFVFTKWSYKENDIEDRLAENITEQSKEEELNQLLIEKGIRQKTDEPVKCFFVNNLVGRKLDKDQNSERVSKYELEEHLSFLQELRLHIESQKEFSTPCLKFLIEQREGLKNQVEKLRLDIQKVELEKNIRQKLIQELEKQQYKELDPYDFELFVFLNILGHCIDCKVIQQLQSNKNYCDQCNNFFLKIQPSNLYDKNLITQNFHILRPMNLHFPSNSAMILRVTYYYSQRYQNQSSIAQTIISPIQKVIYKGWRLHSFLVIEYKDENLNKGQFSLEFRQEGYLMRFQERIFENRFHYYPNYYQEIKNKTIGDLMKLCTEYSSKHPKYDEEIYDDQVFTNEIWKKLQN